MYEFLKANQLDIMLILDGACLVMTILLFNTKFLRKERRAILILMELIAFFLLWFDREAYIYSGNTTELGYIMVRLSNFSVFFLTSGVVFGFNLYLRDLIKNEGGRDKLPVRLIAVQYISVAGMLLAVISALTGLYYYFDENNVYHRGAGFLIAYVIPIVCPIVQYTVIRELKKAVSRLIYISLVLYIFVPIACGILQIFAYGISIVNMAMVLVSIFLYIYAYLDINETVEHAHKIEMEGLYEEKKSMKRLFDQTATAFVSAVERRDSYSQGHSLKAAEYARRIAELSGKSADECDRAYYAALLHDVGMAALPDDVIQSDRDDTEEFIENMRKKPEISGDILMNITEYPYLATGAYYSHEKYDGSGYPEGLKAGAIPEISRIVAVADAYVSMTSDKRYRDAMPGFMAREAFIKGAGTDYDPVFAENMVKIIDMDSNGVEDKLESSLECGEYREQVSNGVRIERNCLRITFDCYAAEGGKDTFHAPSVILYDSYDRHVHRDEKTIEEYRYLEYGEVWFDSHSVGTEARELKEIRLDIPEAAFVGNKYEVTAGRYEDHLKLTMRSPEYAKEVIVALPGGSKSAFLALTGEHCRLENITVNPTGERLGEGDIQRIAEEISYTDRMESDIKNIQIDRPRSSSTEGIELKDRLHLTFHTLSLPGANLVWHCPYVVLFTSGDGKVMGEGYREYVLVKLNGENEEGSDGTVNRFTMKRTPEFPGWEEWKGKNRQGMECEVLVEKRGRKVIITAENLGIRLENITELPDDNAPVYVALTGDECALTDIRVRH
ncbi:MAG: HD domain-containing protein [Lachnospiraceae bacterium]|nr:HD domain-containing protein [Lachnospiraceae bacterium]